MEGAQGQKEGLLAPFRALDLTAELGFLCGKILGDLGADVIKVERPGGDPARYIGPFYHDEVHPERSLYWWAHNANKRGITLNLEHPKGRELFRELVSRADFVLESFRPGYLEERGLDFPSLRWLNPRLILTSITPFGQKGPYSHHKASDLEITALSGCMSIVGEPDRDPLRVSLPQSPLWTGLFAAAGTLLAHYHRELTGRGQQVDVSAQASMLWALSHAPLFWDLNRESPERAGVFLTGRSVTGAKMRTIWPCQDGYICFAVYGGPAGRHTNRALVEWMAERDMAPQWLGEKDWSSFDIATVTQEEIDCFEAVAGAFFAQLTKAEFLREVTRRDMLGYPVATPADILEDPQLPARGFWEEMTPRPGDDPLPFPGAFAKFSQGQCGLWRRAPRVGEHNPQVYVQELGLSPGELEVLAREGII